MIGWISLEIIKGEQNVNFIVMRMNLRWKGQNENKIYFYQGHYLENCVEIDVTAYIYY